MKKKTKKRLIIWACVLVILGTLGFFGYRFALEYFGGYAMKKMISSEINSMLETGEVTIDEVVEIAEAEPVSEPDVPEKEQKQEVAPKPQKPKQTVVEKAAEKVTEGVTREDKREIMRLIGARLTREDVNTLMAMSKDGFTAKEISEAARIAYSRFTPEEIKKVKEFWHKYKSMVKRNNK